MRSIFNKNELLSVPDVKNSDLQFSGNGKHKLLIVINHTENNSGPKEFLKKILNAKKINLEEDVHLLAIDGDEDLSFFNISLEKEIDQIILFGINTKQLGFNISLKKYQTEKVNGITMLFGDEITKIEKEESLKRLLWGCLKDWPDN